MLTAVSLIVTGMFVGPYQVAHADNIVIGNCTDLQKIGNDPSFPLDGSYVLSGPVDCSGTSTWNSDGSGGYYGFAPISGFTGTFNGAGYSITGLYINRPNSSNVSIFGSVASSGQIENLTVSGGSIIGGTNVGGIVGTLADTASVTNATSSVSVTGVQAVGGLAGSASDGTIVSNAVVTGDMTALPASYYVGGLVGYGRGTVSHATSSGTITANNGSYDIGGLVGYSEIAAMISDSNSSETITSSSTIGNVGGLVGINYHDITNSYFTGSLDGGPGSTSIGGIVAQNNEPYGVIDTYYDINTVSIMGGHYPTDYGIYDSQYATWAGGGYAPLSPSSYFVLDSGGYYDIANATDFKNLLAFTHLSAADKFKVTNATSLPAEFYIPYLNVAEFNGNNETISGLSISRASWGDFEGFIGIVSSTTDVKNVNLAGISVSGQGAGGLAYQNNGTIEDSSVTGSVSGNYEVGGFVANQSGVVSGSSANVSVTGILTTGDSSPEYLGGFVGDNEGQITDDYSTSSVTFGHVIGSVPTDIGGFVGFNNDDIFRSYSTGDVSGTAAGENIGGFVGNNGKIIHDSYSVGTVSATTDNGTLGGYIGNDGATIVNGAWYTGAAEYAIGSEYQSPYNGGPEPLLASIDLGTDVATSSDFYDPTQTIYTGGIDGGWDFTSIWNASASAYPTLRALGGQNRGGSAVDVAHTAPAKPALSLNNIGATSVTAISGANEQNGITDVGVVYGTSSTSLSHKDLATNGSIQYSLVLTGLSCGTQYQIAAYAVNSLGTTYSDTQHFTTTACASSGAGAGSHVLSGSTSETSPQTPIITSTISTSTPTIVTTSTSTTTAPIVRDLTLGSKGADVTALQKMLVAQDTGAKAKALAKNGTTSYFGALTKAALAEYQKFLKITPATGYFGPVTRAALKEANIPGLWW